MKFMEVSRDGRGFTSLVFGMGQLSDEGVVKKIAEQISTIAFQAPHALHMDKEFALLQEAALQAFLSGIPEPGTFSEKISMLNILTYKIIQERQELYFEKME